MKPRTARCTRCGKMRYLGKSRIKRIGALCEPCAKHLDGGGDWAMDGQAPETTELGPKEIE